MSPFNLHVLKVVWHWLLTWYYSL